MNNLPNNILVTGGGGFLGGAIVRILVDLQKTVRSLARGFYPELDAMGVHQIQGDISDPDAVEQACEGVELVFHTAAKPGVWGPYEDYFKTNVTGTENVVAACQAHKVRALIHTSSPSVVFDGTDMEGTDESAPYPDHYAAHYPATKALAEKKVAAMVAANGLRAVMLRPHLIWGPRDNHLVPRIIARANRLRIVGDGRNVVDTVYIDNAAHAHILAAEKLLEHPGLSGRVYFISNDEPINLWEMVNKILDAGGKPPITRTISQPAAFKLGASLEFCYNLFNKKSEPPMTRFVAEELATSHWFDISAAKKDLGYQPHVSTEEGLRRLKAWLKKKNVK